MNKENKKIKHLWSLICTSSSVDKTSNNISLFNIIEQLNTTITKDDMVKIGQKAVSIPINFEIVNQFEVLPKTNNFEIRLDIIDPSGICLTKTEHKIEIPNNSNAKNIRFIVKTNGIKITSTGKYNISVNIKEAGEKEFQVVYKIPLNINIIVK